MLNNEKDNLILLRSLKNKKETVLQKVELLNNKIKRMDLKLDIPYQYEAVGPVKFSKNACNNIINTYESLPSQLQRKIPCYSLFGLYAKDFDLWAEEISDEDWVEINTISDFDNATKKLPKLSK